MKPSELFTIETAMAVGVAPLTPGQGRFRQSLQTLWSALGERRAGKLLKDLEKAVGAKGNPGEQGAQVVRSPDDSAQPAKLSELGTSHEQSSHWQKLASVPQDHHARREGTSANSRRGDTQLTRGS